MHSQNLLRLFFAAVAAIVLIALISAFAAVNVVQSSRLTDQTRVFPFTATDLLPSECSGMNLTNIVYCTGTATCEGTAANDLILGTSLNNYDATEINGGQGDDCILAGGGDDTINGGGGKNDVCIGGPGTDTFGSSCEIWYQ